MSDTVLVALITFLSGSAVTAIVAAYFNRRRTAADTRLVDAETEATESNTRRSEVAYYQKQLDKTTDKMEALEELVKNLEKAIAAAQTKYEQRVGQLHGKIDSLSSELERANRNLDTANATIGELRQEVKDGNAVITELRSEITQLLVDRAEKKQGD